MQGHQPDPLEQAHLLYMRGELEEAQELVTAELMRGPGNRVAAELDELLALARVKRDQEVVAHRPWLDSMEPTAGGLAFLVVLALACFAGAAWFLVDWVRIGEAQGFGCEVIWTHTTRGGHVYHTPLPLSLVRVFPALVLGSAGAWLARSLYKYWHD